MEPINPYQEVADAASRKKADEMAELQGLYRRVFDSPEGQRVLEHLCRQAFISASTFTPGQPDVTAFKEGQRHIVLSIVRFVERDIREILTQHYGATS